MTKYLEIEIVEKKKFHQIRQTPTHTQTQTIRVRGILSFFFVYVGVFVFVPQTMLVFG